MKDFMKQIKGFTPSEYSTNESSQFQPCKGNYIGDYAGETCYFSYSVEGREVLSLHLSNGAIDYRVNGISTQISVDDGSRKFEFLVRLSKDISKIKENYYS